MSKGEVAERRVARVRWSLTFVLVSGSTSGLSFPRLAGKLAVLAVVGSGCDLLLSNRMSPTALGQKKKSYYGGNLAVLREYIPSSSVDLIFLDPPFNSRQDYNCLFVETVLFAEEDGSRSRSQMNAVKDIWDSNQNPSRSYEEIVERGGELMR